jgi:hypothetical protein
VGAVSASDWSGLLQDRPLKELQLSLLSGELLKVLGRMESLRTFRWEGTFSRVAQLRDLCSIFKKHGVTIGLVKSKPALPSVTRSLWL